MAQCVACEKIEINKRGVPKHSALQSTGVKGLASQPYGQSRVNIEMFTCSECGTKWEYENDSNDSFAGWSRV